MSFHCRLTIVSVSVSPQMLSLLPQRILRLLEFIGFSGNRVSSALIIYIFIIKLISLLEQDFRLAFLQEFGLSQLREGASSQSLRSILSALTLLFYHTYVSLILGKENTHTHSIKHLVSEVMVLMFLSFDKELERGTWWRPKLCWSRTNTNTLK